MRWVLIRSPRLRQLRQKVRRDLDFTRAPGANSSVGAGNGAGSGRVFGHFQPDQAS